MSTESMFGRLLIRVDAGPQMGTGHWMRTLSLAQAWTLRGGVVRFVTHLPPDDPLASLAQRPGMEATFLETVPASREDLDATLTAIRDFNPQALVLDGYHFDSHYRAALKQTGTPLWVIDDLADEDLSSASGILNQNLYAAPEDYNERISPETQLLLGPQFALLRPEFRSLRPKNVQIASVTSSILITMGGADPANATLAVLKLIARMKLPPLDLTIVLGAANPHGDSIAAAVQRLEEHHRVAILRHPPDLVERLRAADLVISAAGTTALELACLGRPAALVVAAENQRRVAAAFAAQEAAVSLGDSAELASSDAAERLAQVIGSSGQRQAIAARAHLWVDGNGTHRVAETLATHPVRLRAVTQDDSDLLFTWANDPVTRSMSFNAEPIPRPSHDAWFANRLRDPDTRFFMAVAPRGTAVGQIRFDRDGANATLSISVAPEARGRGLAPKMARLGAFNILDSGWASRVLAWVIEGNEPSTRTFQRSGFALSKRTRHQDRPSLLFELTTEGLHPPAAAAIEKASNP